jgi:hypothetical protein
MWEAVFTSSVFEKIVLYRKNTWPLRECGRRAPEKNLFNEDGEMIDATTRSRLQAFMLGFAAFASNRKAG